MRSFIKSCLSLKPERKTINTIGQCPVFTQYVNFVRKICFDYVQKVIIILYKQPRVKFGVEF